MVMTVADKECLADVNCKALNCMTIGLCLWLSWALKNIRSLNKFLKCSLHTI